MLIFGIGFFGNMASRETLIGFVGSVGARHLAPAGRGDFDPEPLWKPVKGDELIRFNNDYNRAAHPRVLRALSATNGESYGGYGQDAWCELAAERIRDAACVSRAAVHFVIGGTQANYLVIASALRPYQSVLCADTGHINVHETGAVEHVGHKVESLLGVCGKITAEQVEQAAVAFETSVVPEHITQPKMVYLSFPTEVGTLYSLGELEAISRVCRAHGLYLFVDGARLAYGLASPENDVTLADMARLADVFTVGGTKCGALFGEAVVLVNPDLHEGFRSNMKQNGAMLAKGWLLGLQFSALFDEGDSGVLYFELGKGAVEQALRIRRAFEEAGASFSVESSTNQQFVILPDSALDILARDFVFEFEERVDSIHSCVRFCTSWSTRSEEVDALVEAIRALPRLS